MSQDSGRFSGAVISPGEHRTGVPSPPLLGHDLLSRCLQPLGKEQFQALETTPHKPNSHSYSGMFLGYCWGQGEKARAEEAGFEQEYKIRL